MGHRMNSLDPKKSLNNIYNDVIMIDMASSCPKLVSLSNHVTLSVKLHFVSVKLCVWALYIFWRNIIAEVVFSIQPNESTVL